MRMRFWSKTGVLRLGPNVSYHVSELHKLGAIALVRQRQVRGVMEHVYTATVRESASAKNRSRRMHLRHHGG
jgi:hypothetical protein